MEYSDGEVEKYITESLKRIIQMDKDIKGGQMAMNTAESSRMACNGERE